jgi:hypothetical protein
MKKCVHDLCHLCADELAIADALQRREALSTLVIALAKKKPELIEAALGDTQAALVRIPEVAAAQGSGGAYSGGEPVSGGVKRCERGG